jgi:hypothetical protein
MVEPLLPIFNGPGVLGQRFGQFFGAQTILSNLTVANGATITIADGSGNFMILSATGGTETIGGQANTIAVVPGINRAIIQSGDVTATPNGTGHFTVTFPVAFPNVVDSVVVCNGNGTNNATQLTSVDHSGGLTLSNFVVLVVNSTTGAAITTAVEVMWIATGH